MSRPPASRRLGALGRVAVLRLESAERRRALARKREAEAAELLRRTEEVLEAYVIRLPSLRRKTYRDHATAEMNRGSVQILLSALTALDDAIKPMTADIETARSDLEDRRRARAEAEADYRRHRAAQRRREALLARLAADEADLAEYREELQFEEWTRPCPS